MEEGLKWGSIIEIFSQKWKTIAQHLKNRIVHPNPKNLIIFLEYREEKIL